MSSSVSDHIPKNTNKTRSMPLIEQLLLEPYPFEIWICDRTDAKGSGTLNDPYRATSAAEFDAIMNG